MTIEKYSLAAGTWEDVAVTSDHRQVYCACAFVDKIFLFGGWGAGTSGTGTGPPCGATQGAVAPMEERWRRFRGEDRGLRGDRVKWAHGYDAREDTWTPMPDMVVERKGHHVSRWQ